MKNKNGFTLVELLAVIVVLAIILGITIPGFIRILEASRNKSFVNQGLLVEEAAKKYELTTELDFGEDGIAKIPISDLVAANEIDEIFGPTGDSCTGEVWVTKVGNIYEYETIMQCGTYETTDYSARTRGVPAVPENDANIYVGGLHVGMIKADKTLHMVGYNYHGQLGDGTEIDKASPVAISIPGETIKMVDLGYRHSGIVTDSGKLYTMGYNDDGQIGDGTETDRDVPTEITIGTETIKSISLGYATTGIITTSGKLYMTGYNTYGNFGDGTDTGNTAPAEITISGETIESVSVGFYHTGIITTSGKLYMTGRNNNGQLGDGTTDSKLTPVEVTIPGETIERVTLGAYHTAFFTASGKLYMAGTNSYGALGDGTTEHKSTPVEITIPGETIESVGLGQYHSGIVTTSGKLYMAGYNNYGQLGDGTQINRSTPVEITIPGEIVKNVTAGNENTGVATVTGNVYMIGRNYYGQLANDSVFTSEVIGFTKKTFDEEIVMITTQYAASGIITASGKLYTGGANWFGQIGNGTKTTPPAPVEITIPNETIASVEMGKYVTGIITNSGKLFMTGRNNLGQLGDGTIVDKTTPVEITIPGETIKEVKTGEAHTGIVTTSGKLFMTGYTRYGAFGNGSEVVEAILSPVEITIPGETISTISLGSGTSAIMTVSGKLFMTGRNSSGQLGDTTIINKFTPIELTIPGETIASVGLGSFHTGIITTSGKLFMTGDNGYGQIGNSTASDVHAPVQISIAGETFTSVDGGDYNTGMITTSGKLYRTGENDDGQLGDGTKVNKYAPVEITAISEVVTSFSVADNSALALTTDGELYITGSNGSGQLLEATLSAVPLQVIF